MTCCCDVVMGCGDTMVPSVDESVCGVQTAMTAGELDVCACVDILVSDEAGESSGVEVLVSVDDVVACGDDPLVPDVVRVGDWLSVVGDALLCVARVARSGRADIESSVVFWPGVAPPGGMDGLVCLDDSLRPEPPPGLPSGTY